jgi:predicted dehydrogenase
VSTEKLRAGVVGVGHIGRNHARVYTELESTTLTAVYDSDPRAAQEISRRYQAHAAASLDEFISMVDLATLSTPTPYHCEIGMALLDGGVHVLVEKPITRTTEEARQLVEAARKANRVLQVGHIERFNPVMSALEERLTRARFIEAHRLSSYPGRSTDIGVVLDLMIHDIEIVLHLVKSAVKSIDAVGIPVLSSTEDIANARLRFENGCVANITASRVSPEKMRKIRVFQEDAYLSLDYQAQAGQIYRKTGAGIEIEKVQLEKAEPLALELASFANCCRVGEEPKVSGHQAMAALQLALEITHLAEENSKLDS